MGWRRQRILKERTMANSGRNVQLFGFPVWLPEEEEVPGFRVTPPEVPGFRVMPPEVPGFRTNPDGTVRLPTERPSNLADYASPSVMAAVTPSPLGPRIDPEIGLEVEVAPAPPPPPSMERNRLGISPEILMDPDLQPFYMDVPGRVLPRAKPWPYRRQDR
jgi:hypothetical protein